VKIVRKLSAVLLCLLIVATVFQNFCFLNASAAQMSPDVFVGVDMGYGTDVAGVKNLIDQVSSFTNFFILGNTALSMNLTRLNETLQYAYDKGLYFMSFTPPLSLNGGAPNSTRAWLNYTKNSWGNHLVGFMYPWEDEPGGHQLDNDTSSSHSKPVASMTNSSYIEAASQFVNSTWFQLLNLTKKDALNSTNYKLFTSDYDLYWFDYKGGYDGLFAEFGWNYSTQLNVALCRGAATAQNRDWGVIITYKYTTSPYMESGEDLYKDLIYAYNNGAKYIVVLDTNANWTSSVLTSEHYQALRQFWQYIQNNPRNAYTVSERIAYALPEAYAYGFRGSLDKIWGVWPADMTSFMLSISVNIMLEKYGSKLDIIYEDALQPGNTYGFNNNYGKIIYWNDPAAVSDAWPSSFLPTTSTASAPSENTTITPEPSATLSSTPSPTLFTSQNPSISSTLKPKSSQDGNPGNPSIEYIYIILVGIATAVFIVALIFFRKKLRSNAFRAN
jgi:hypothetical protein